VSEAVLLNEELLKFLIKTSITVNIICIRIFKLMFVFKVYLFWTGLFYTVLSIQFVTGFSTNFCF
jgi:hypothetical protein